MDQQNNGKIKNIVATIFLGALGSILATLIINGFGRIRTIYSLPDTVADIETKINEFSTQLNEIQSYISFNQNNTSEPNNNYTPHSTTNYVLHPTDSFKANITPIHQSEGFLLTSPSCKNTDTIAINTKNGEEYTAEELENQKILLAYNEENQEIFFYGQFNENIHWNGECLINVYINNNLILITEAEYDDGNLLNYKQVINDDTWIISERLNEGDYNSGNSWCYTFENEYIKWFDINTVVSENIMDIDKFKLNQNLHLESFYHGNTSDGYYNDNTGKAYRVTYLEDGTVKSLYVGNFKNGNPDDKTGTAWQIVFDDDNNRYFYYKGTFTQGYRDGEVNGDNYITQEQINNEIDSMTFDCELNWHDINN